MFKIIALEREYGAGGSLVARELARRKGWRLLDQELTCEIARLAGVHEKTVAQRSERCDPLLHRLAKVFWRGSHERLLPIEDHIFDADQMVELAHRIIEGRGREGNCVIVGRGAPYILRRRSDTFRVFVYGSRPEKINRLAGLKMDAAEAAELVDTIDSERAAFVRRYYHAQWPSRHLYHMLLNSDPGIEYATETVLAAMEKLDRFGHPESSAEHASVDFLDPQKP